MRTFIVLILIILVSSCSQKNSLTYAERDNAYFQYIKDKALVNVKKINSFRFDGWQSLSRKFLIISTSIKRKYLIEVTRDCNNLTYTQQLILNQSTNGSLSARFDSISSIEDKDSVGCRIQAIYPLTVEQAKEIVNIGVPTNDEANADS
ncbi:DUF6491 family protein [Thalassotalea piscium]